MFSKQKTIFLMAHFLLLSFVTFGYDPDENRTNTFIVNAHRGGSGSGQGYEISSGLQEARNMLPRLREQNVQVQQQEYINSQYTYIQAIKNRPHLLKVYQQVCEAHVCIQNINHPDIPTRIFTRITLLESDLQPPYNKPFQKSLTKLKQACTNGNVNALINIDNINVEQVFKEFLKKTIFKSW
jgi:hypothetical protein